MSKEFTKVVYVGELPRVGGIFCRVEYQNGRLSVTGVEGPLGNGDARGSSGQIERRCAHRDLADDDPRTPREYLTTPEQIAFAEGWSSSLWLDFLSVWHRWHLNDMRAGCVHQRAAGWGSEPLEVVTYRLTHEAQRARDVAIERAARAKAADVPCYLSPTERALVLMEYWFKDRHAPPDADSPLSGCFEVKKRETSLSGWVYECEHPRGVLMKPCPACGYRYGSAWLREEVPDDVLRFLRDLPDAARTPAWV